MHSSVSKLFFATVRCILERPAEDHFLRQRYILAPPVEENLSHRAVYFYSASATTYTSPKYGAPVGDALRPRSISPARPGMRSNPCEPVWIGLGDIHSQSTYKSKFNSRGAIGYNIVSCHLELAYSQHTQ
jgi:hypothetical protein